MLVQVKDMDRIQVGKLSKLFYWKFMIFYKLSIIYFILIICMFDIFLSQMQSLF